MSSNSTTSFPLPVVSPPSAKATDRQANVQSPTCVGRSLDYSHDQKENANNASKDIIALVASSTSFASSTKNTKTNAATSVSPSPAKKEIRHIAPKEIISEPKYKIDKYCVPELKAILSDNMQHISGAKEELIARIVDGEKYGRLGACPDCIQGRLKIRPHHPDVVFCPGHYDAFYGYAVSCGYTTTADEAPRRGRWMSPPLRRIKIPEISPRDKIMADIKKHSKKELGDSLTSNGQDGKGAKKFLLERIIDAKLHGLLGVCTRCGHKALKVQDSAPDAIVCFRHKGCTCDFKCSVENAPRCGEWEVEA